MLSHGLHSYLCSCRAAETGEQSIAQQLGVQCRQTPGARAQQESDSLAPRNWGKKDVVIHNTSYRAVPTEHVVRNGMLKLPCMGKLIFYRNQNQCCSFLGCLNTVAWDGM